MKVIAEIGVNWRNLDEADKMIREAARAGADMCKFQAYTAAEGPFAVGSQLYNIILDEMAVRYLYWRCRAADVEFLCTPMYPEAVPMLDPYVKRWKVRYKDRENREILDAIEKTGKPALISGKNIFCIPEYPPAYSSHFPENWFAGYEGLSSHFPDPYLDQRLVEWGSFEYLEVHVKRDEYNPAWCPPDNSVSITMSELAELCRRLKK